MVYLPNSMVDLPNPIEDLLNTIVDLPNSMVDLPNTMVDLPNTMMDVPNTMVDLPNTIVLSFSFCFSVSSCFFLLFLFLPVSSHFPHLFQFILKILHQEFGTYCLGLVLTLFSLTVDWPIFFGKLLT